MRSRAGIGNRPDGLFRSPDQIKLAVSANLTDEHGPPGVLGFVIHRHNSLRCIEALAPDSLEHLGNLFRLCLDHGLRPEEHAAIRSFHHVAGDAVRTIHRLELPDKLPVFGPVDRLEIVPGRVVSHHVAQRESA